VETGVQGSCNYLEERVSGACPGPDPGFAGMTKMGSFRLFTRSSTMPLFDLFKGPLLVGKRDHSAHNPWCSKSPFSCLYLNVAKNISKDPPHPTLSPSGRGVGVRANGHRR